MQERFSKTLMIPVFMAVVLFVPVCHSQTISVDSMKALLESEAKYTAEDFELVDSGEIALKRLPAKNKREIAVCGLIRINLPFDVVLEGYQQTINQQKKETAKDFGRFSDPPAPTDLDPLEFDERDIESLGKCRPGNCSWSLPTAMIERLHSEIDWKSPDHNKRASALIKTMLIAYLAEYLKQGDGALIEYNDKPAVLRLKDEYQNPHSALFWSAAFAPEYSEYFAGFPKRNLAGVENTVSWAKIKVGLKQVVLLTHNVNYIKEKEGVSQAMLISRQIYANHYFDSTISMTTIVGFPEKDGKYETYLLFVNHSSARALGGTIGKLVGGFVNSQATDRMQDVLSDTKRNSARVYANRFQAAPVKDVGFVATIVKQPYFLGLIFIILIAGAVILLISWRTRHP